MAGLLFIHEKAFLEAKLAALETELANLGVELGEAMNQSSETWHDNYPAQVVEEKSDWVTSQIAEYRKLLLGRQVNYPKSDKKVAAGLIDKLSGSSEQLFEIGHVLVDAASQLEPKAKLITIEAPIAATLLEKSIGDEIVLSSGAYTIIELVRPR